MDRQVELAWITERPLEAVRAWAESKLLPALMTVLGNVPAKIRRILLDVPGCTEVFTRA